MLMYCPKSVERMKKIFIVGTAVDFAKAFRCVRAEGWKKILLAQGQPHCQAVSMRPPCESFVEKKKFKKREFTISLSDC